MLSSKLKQDRGGKGEKQENKIHAEGSSHIYKFYKYVTNVPLLRIHEQSLCSFLSRLLRIAIAIILLNMARKRLYELPPCLSYLYLNPFFILILAMLYDLSLSAPLNNRNNEETSCSGPVPATWDVVIYGSTPAALVAAIQTTRMNRTVAIVSPTNHIGGMLVSGLGWTDSKNGNAIGGIAREFFTRVYDYYESSSAWTYGTRAGYIGENIAAQPGPAIDQSNMSLSRYWKTGLRS
jgi:hypothetical protein